MRNIKCEIWGSTYDNKAKHLCWWEPMIQGDEGKELGSVEASQGSARGFLATFDKETRGCQN